MLNELPDLLTTDNITINIEEYVKRFFTEMINENQNKIFPEKCIDSLLQDVIDIGKSMHYPLYYNEGSVKLFSDDGSNMVEFLGISNGHCLAFSKIIYQGKTPVVTRTIQSDCISKHHWFTPETYCMGLYMFDSTREITLMENEYFIQ